jgi:D-glycero-D-manno-heptose 1,7-bisphosphate phosphatase
MTNLTAKRAAFIDRDGTLVEEVNFLSKPEDLRIYAFTKDALTRLKHHGFLVIVVTNQSGIGRSIYSESDMHVIHDRMNVELPGLIDAFYFCPHLPNEGCLCRKPKLGMFEAARRDFEIDLSGSWMIGDKQLDVETGFNAGVSTALVKTGYGSDHQHRLERRPDVIVEDLSSAVDEIIKLMNPVCQPMETIR